MRIMKSVTILLLVVALMACSRNGCLMSRSSLSKEEVSKVLPRALCAKMVECAPAGSTLNLEQCEIVMNKQVIDGKNGKPFPNISKKQLDACIAGLTGWSCAQAQTSAEPPVGCEFMVQK